MDTGKKYLVRFSYPYTSGEITYIGHWCPACEEMHSFALQPMPKTAARWTWNQDAYKPTFRPSMHIKVGPDSRGKISICHYHLEDGKLRYCTDSTHRLAGETVPLPPLPKHILLSGSYEVL